MIKPSYEWDDQKGRLVRIPDSPACTREDNMLFADQVKMIEGDDKQASDVARYEQASLAFEMRQWYQPCDTLPGGYGPTWLREPSRLDFQRIGQGIRDIAATGGGTSAVEQLLEDSRDAADASAFKKYVDRVAVVELHNESNLRALLMAHAWLSELNAGSDDGKVAELRRLLREWYNIVEPEDDPWFRSAQAKHHAKNLRWLSAAWRSVWSPGS